MIDWNVDWTMEGIADLFLIGYTGLLIIFIIVFVVTRCLLFVQDHAKRRVHVVCVEGEIGAGKTTLIKALEAHYKGKGYRVVVGREPVDMWTKVGILQAFYASLKRPMALHTDDAVRSMAYEHAAMTAYDFQTYTFVTRIKALRAAIQRSKSEDGRPVIYILERCVWTDRYVFMELQREIVGEMRMKMYDEWWNMWNRIVPVVPTQMVYLKPSLSTAMQRVQRRDRDGEKGGGVTRDYQQLLRKVHECYLENKHADAFPHMPPRPFSAKDVLVIEDDLADADFTDATSLATRRILDRIETALAQN